MQRITGCAYAVLGGGGVEQRPLGNMGCKHMTFKGLQVEAQTWGEYRGWWGKAGEMCALGFREWNVKAVDLERLGLGI